MFPTFSIKENTGVHGVGVGEMAQQLGAHNFLSGDPGLVLSIYIAANNHL